MSARLRRLGALNTTVKPSSTKLRKRPNSLSGCPATSTRFTGSSTSTLPPTRMMDTYVARWHSPKLTCAGAANRPSNGTFVPFARAASSSLACIMSSNKLRGSTNTDSALRRKYAPSVTGLSYKYGSSTSLPSKRRPPSAFSKCSATWRSAGFVPAWAASFFRARAKPDLLQENSTTGYMSTVCKLAMVCPVEGTMRRISSSSSPKKSSRTGKVRLPGYTSMVPPRVQNVPGPSSSPVLAKPRASSA